MERAELKLSSMFGDLGFDIVATGSDSVAP